jgi:hypothetical protein
VNKTFEELDKIHQFAQTWVNSPLNLTALLGDLQNTNNIKVKSNFVLFAQQFDFLESFIQSFISRIICRYHRNGYI